MIRCGIRIFQPPAKPFLPAVLGDELILFSLYFRYPLLGTAAEFLDRHTTDPHSKPAQVQFFPRGLPAKNIVFIDRLFTSLHIDHSNFTHFRHLIRIARKPHAYLNPIPQ